MRAPTIRRAIVTGATGFIGRAVADRLQREGWTVVGAARHPATGPWDRLEVIDLASENRDGLESIGIGPGDVVINAAGVAHDTSDSQVETEAYFAVNARGAGWLARVARDGGAAAFIQISSVKAVADTTPQGPVDEGASPAPRTPYGSSKLAGEQAVLAVLGGTVPVAVLRLTPVYGPGSKGNLDRLLHASRRPWVPVLPSRCGRRSMVHVDDVADLVARLAAAPANVVAVVSDGNRYSPREIQDRVLGAVGRRARIAIPRWGVRLAGGGGSALQAAFGHPVPFSRSDVDRLLLDAIYEQRAPLPVDWVPTTDLYRSMGLA